jgi:hypothetical protein
MAAVSQERFQKRQREKARREKAAAKSARREERRSGRDEAPPSTPPSEEAQVLAELAELHARYDAGDIALDDFVAAKEELTQRLNIQ